METRAKSLEIPRSIKSIKGGALEDFEMLVIHGNPKCGTNLRVFGWDKMPTVYGEKIVL